MTEPENHTIRLLQEMREEIRQRFTGIEERVSSLQATMDAGFAELRVDVGDLKRQRAKDRDLLEDIAREMGMEPTTAQLKREKREAEVNERLARLEAKVFPPK